MRLMKRGPYFWVDYRGPDGKRHRMSTREMDETAAYVAAGVIVKDAMIAASKPPEDLRLTLGNLLESTYVQKWGRSKSSINMRHTVNMLQREFDGVRAGDVTTKLLRSYCERWLTEGIAAATVNRRMSTIGVALSRAAEDGDITARPKMPHFTENNTKERYMTVAEEAAVFRELKMRARFSVDMPGVGPDYVYLGNLAAFLLDTGFRFSEAFKFTLVDGRADLLNGATKNGKGRRVPLTKRARAAGEYLLKSERHQALMASGEIKPWQWASHRWGVITKAAGCPDVTLHILRHTCASRLIQANVPIFTVSKWLGHSSVKITERYAKLAPDSLAMALAALED
jgi:integrase